MLSVGICEGTPRLSRTLRVVSISLCLGFWRFLSTFFPQKLCTSFTMCSFCVTSRVRSRVIVVALWAYLVLIWIPSVNLRHRRSSTFAAAVRTLAVMGSRYITYSIILQKNFLINTLLYPRLVYHVMWIIFLWMFSAAVNLFSNIFSVSA